MSSRVDEKEVREVSGREDMVSEDVNGFLIRGPAFVFDKRHAQLQLFYVCNENTEGTHSVCFVVILLFTSAFLAVCSMFNINTAGS